MSKKEVFAHSTFYLAAACSHQLLALLCDIHPLLLLSPTTTTTTTTTSMTTSHLELTPFPSSAFKQTARSPRSSVSNFRIMYLNCSCFPQHSLDSLT